MPCKSFLLFIVFFSVFLCLPVFLLLRCLVFWSDGQLGDLGLDGYHVILHVLGPLVQLPQLAGSQAAAENTLGLGDAGLGRKLDLIVPGLRGDQRGVGRQDGLAVPFTSLPCPRLSQCKCPLPPHYHSCPTKRASVTPFPSLAAAAQVPSPSPARP